MKRSTIVSLPFKIISFGDQGVHIQFDAHIGETNVSMLIDTGASITFFDQKFINQILPEAKHESIDKSSTAVGSNEIQSSMVKIPQLLLGEIVLKNQKVAVIDLSHVNISYIENGQQPIHGILGGDILMKTKACIDYQHEVLLLNHF